MIVELDDSQATEWILDHYTEANGTISKAILHKEFSGYQDTETANVIDEGFGEWFCLAMGISNALATYTLIRTDSFESAYDLFLDQFESDVNDGEEGYFTASGKWFAETTTAYVNLINPDRIEIYIVEG